MDYYAVACLIPMFIRALLASQRVDMFGFWTTLFWILSALSAAIGVYIYRGAEGGAIFIVEMFYLVLPIFLLANFRSHVTLLRLVADVYTVTAAPFHLAAWASNKLLNQVTKGSIPLKIANPWSILNYKPTTSRSWEIIQEKRKRRWSKVTTWLKGQYE